MNNGILVDIESHLFETIMNATGIGDYLVQWMLLSLMVSLFVASVAKKRIWSVTILLPVPVCAVFLLISYAFPTYKQVQPETESHWVEIRCGEFCAIHLSEQEGVLKPVYSEDNLSLMDGQQPCLRFEKYNNGLVTRTYVSLEKDKSKCDSLLLEEGHSENEQTYSKTPLHIRVIMIAKQASRWKFYRFQYPVNMMGSRLLSP